MIVFDFVMAADYYDQTVMVVVDFDQTVMAADYCDQNAMANYSDSTVAVSGYFD